MRCPTTCGRSSPHGRHLRDLPCTRTGQGIWEMRGRLLAFVASKVMCWVAIDRGIRLAQGRDDVERATRWQQAAGALKDEIIAKGSTPAVRSRSTTAPARSARRCCSSIMGFLPPDDERVRTTVLAIADEAHPGRPACSATRSRPPTTGSPARRARSPSARSGWCRRWR
ncbi:MAG: glycoside hydrolase family 15 protein [Acidimicrobiia bacterium]